MTTAEMPEGYPDDTREPWPGDPDEQSPPDVPVAPELSEERDDPTLDKVDTTGEATVEPPD